MADKQLSNWLYADMDDLIHCDFEAEQVRPWPTIRQLVRQNGLTKAIEIAEGAEL